MKFSDKVLASYDNLKGYAFRLTRDRHRAEDLVSETIVRLLENEAGYTEQGMFDAWAFRIMRNIHFTNGRAVKRFHAKMELGWFADDAAVEPSQEDRLTMLEVQAALEVLRPDHRKIIVNVMVLGHSYEDTAKAFGIEVGTVKSQLWRAREQLVKAYYGTTEGSGYVAPEFHPGVRPKEAPSSDPIIVATPVRPRGRSGPKVKPGSKNQQVIQKRKMLARLRAMGRVFPGRVPKAVTKDDCK